MLGEALTSTRDAPLEGMLYWVAYAATGIELLAVAIIVVVILYRDGVLRDEDRGAASRQRHV